MNIQCISEVINLNSCQDCLVMAEAKNICNLRIK